MTAESKSPVYEIGELRSTGLLWLINTSVFHPRGLALALHYAPDDDPEHRNPVGWSLVAAGPGEAYDFVPGPAIDESFRSAELTMELARSFSSDLDGES